MIWGDLDIHAIIIAKLKDGWVKTFELINFDNSVIEFPVVPENPIAVVLRGSTLREYDRCPSPPEREKNTAAGPVPGNVAVRRCLGIAH
jgi:hypothetical protein